MGLKRVGILAALALAVPLAAAVGVPAPARAGSVSTAALSGHKAVYDIRLDKAPGGGVLAAAGTSVYKVDRACSGWTTENLTTLTLTYESEGDFRQMWTMATWESGDGADFRGRVIEYRTEGEVERVTSRAHVGVNGGRAVYSEPEPVERALPKDTRFTMTHLAEVLETAKAGGRQLSRVLFDGGNKDNPYTVNAIVLRQMPAAEASELARRFELPDMPAWRIHMAFFPYGVQTGEPDFEIEGTYRADGIASDVVQDFGSFRLRLKLKELKLTGKPDC